MKVRIHYERPDKTRAVITLDLSDLRRDAIPSYCRGYCQVMHTRFLNYEVVK